VEDFPCIFLACFSMMSPIAFIISPRISIIWAVIVGSVGCPPPIMPGAIAG